MGNLFARSTSHFRWFGVRAWITADITVSWEIRNFSDWRGATKILRPFLGSKMCLGQNVQTGFSITVLKPHHRVVFWLERAIFFVLNNCLFLFRTRVRVWRLVWPSGLIFWSDISMEQLRQPGDSGIATGSLLKPLLPDFGQKPLISVFFRTAEKIKGKTSDYQKSE